MGFRGKHSAAMIYDRKPIIDYFRKIDDDRVLGLMEMRGMERPFFFLLTRVPNPRGGPPSGVWFLEAGRERRDIDRPLGADD